MRVREVWEETHTRARLPSYCFSKWSNLKNLETWESFVRQIKTMKAVELNLWFEG